MNKCHTKKSHNPQASKTENVRNQPNKSRRFISLKILSAIYIPSSKPKRWKVKKAQQSLLLTITSFTFLLPFDGAANKQIVWRQTSETQNKYHVNVNVNALPSWPMSAVIMETSQNKRFPRLLNRTGGEIGKPKDNFVFSGSICVYLSLDLIGEYMRCYTLKPKKMDSKNSNGNKNFHLFWILKVCFTDR